LELKRDEITQNFIAFFFRIQKKKFDRKFVGKGSPWISEEIRGAKRAAPTDRPLPRVAARFAGLSGNAYRVRQLCQRHAIGSFSEPADLLSGGRWHKLI
jgi:hypothetical protein